MSVTILINLSQELCLFPRAFHTFCRGTLCVNKGHVVLSVSPGVFPLAAEQQILRWLTPTWHEPKLLLSYSCFLTKPCIYNIFPDIHDMGHQLYSSIVATIQHIAILFIDIYNVTISLVRRHLLLVDLLHQMPQYVKYYHNSTVPIYFHMLIIVSASTSSLLIHSVKHFQPILKDRYWVLLIRKLIEVHLPTFLDRILFF